MQRDVQAPWIVSWYRARDAHRPIIRLWAVGATLLVMGGLTTAVALTHLVSLSDLMRGVLGVLGFAAVVSGPTLTIVGITRHMMRDDDALLMLRSDGVVLRGPAGERLVRWEALDEVVEDDGGLLLGCEDGPALVVRERFDVSFAELAREIRATQRRALMGVLRPPKTEGRGSGAALRW